MELKIDIPFDIYRQYRIYVFKYMEKFDENIKRLDSDQITPEELKHQNKDARINQMKKEITFDFWMLNIYKEKL